MKLKRVRYIVPNGEKNELWSVGWLIKEGADNYYLIYDDQYGENYVHDRDIRRVSEFGWTHEFVTDKKQWRDTMDRFMKKRKGVLEYLKKCT